MASSNGRAQARYSWGHGRKCEGTSSAGGLEKKTEGKESKPPRDYSLDRRDLFEARVRSGYTTRGRILKTYGM